jgi:hypothetical protein
MRAGATNGVAESRGRDELPCLALTDGLEGEALTAAILYHDQCARHS